MLIRSIFNILLDFFLGFGNALNIRMKKKEKKNNIILKILK